MEKNYWLLGSIQEISILMMQPFTETNEVLSCFYDLFALYLYFATLAMQLSQQNCTE